MPTHLTRLVIRRILSNEPIVYRGCVRRRANAALTTGAHRISGNGYAQRRSLFGFSRKPAREVKEPDVAPGLEGMLRLHKALTDQGRPPPARSLGRSFRDLFQSKLDNREPLSDVEAAHALNTFRHLLKEEEKLEDTSPRYLSKNLLEDALYVLAYESARSDVHLLLAEEIFQHLEARRLAAGDAYTVAQAHVFCSLLKVMCQNGQTMRARDCLKEKAKRLQSLNDLFVRSKPWQIILRGFEEQNEPAELPRTLELMEELGIPIQRRLKAQLLEIYAKRGDLNEARKWYDDMIGDSDARSQLPCEAVRATVKCCIEHNELKWGQSVIRFILEAIEQNYSEDKISRNRVKLLWDTVFLWAAASGKGVDEVDRMMGVMVQRSFSDGTSIQPDVDTINQLVEWCNSRNEPYFAERYIALGLKWKINPDAATFKLQALYRLSTGDISGASTSYKHLLAQDCSNNEDIHVANKLVQAMCARKYSFKAIMSLVDDLNERKARFEPETVSVLSVLHLQRDELHDVIDLLQTHSYHFSEEQRLKIADALVALILDRKHTTTARAWDTYTIAQSIFPELRRDTRTAIMDEFFARGRADLACHIFAQMRELAHANTKATADTYVAVLQGVAAHAAAHGSATDTDVEADDRDEASALLEAVHNGLKLDLDLDAPDTRLRNALMLAYTACGQPVRAWGFWEDIINSTEGPSFSSIAIAFRACERMNVGGDARARALWARLRAMDVDVSKDMFAAYVGALAGSQRVEEAMEVLVSGEKEFGWRVDAFLLGTLFNAAFGVKKQEGIEKWIKAKYPAQWQELLRLGVQKTEDGPRLFNIDRRLKP